MMLTASQLDSWKENGYVAYDAEPLLTPEECQAIGTRAEEIARGKFPDLPEDVYSVEGAVRRGEITNVDPYDKYRIVRFLHKYDDLILAICKSPRILDVVEDLLGPVIKLYTDQVFMKPPYHGGAQGWHQDSATWTFFQPHDHVTCWIAIDEATEENGCLRYLKGSHKYGYVEPKHTQVLVDQLRKEEPECEVPVPRKPGYAVLHHSLTLHASAPNKSPYRRRSIGIHYIRANTRYIPIDGDYPGPFLLMRGKEIPGRV
jgi:phytanoyl-CoA hydroxylase